MTHPFELILDKAVRRLLFSVPGTSRQDWFRQVARWQTSEVVSLVAVRSGAAELST